MDKLPPQTGTKQVHVVLQHVKTSQSNRSACDGRIVMGGLDANWLSADLARVEADMGSWSLGLKESFESLRLEYGIESENDTEHLPAEEGL